jgi:hypothetical protein
MEAEFWANYFSAVVNVNESSYEPITDMLYPIIEKGRQTANDSALTHETVVGVVGASFFWRDLLKSDLHSRESDVVVVFRSECADPFTYSVG